MDVDVPGQVPADGNDVTCDLDRNDDNELDEDEADELVGRLVDYVSDLALLPDTITVP